MATIGAEQIFKEFREHSAAEFFKKNRQMLGYSGAGRSLVTIVHEYTSNSLDAAEEAGILPDIKVEIKKLENGHYTVSVADNGPGIPKNFIGKALATIFAGTKFHRYMQQRGQQGIGAAGCLLFSQVTTGKPIYIKSSTGKGKCYSCRLGINTALNKPIITEMKESDDDFRGLFVEGEFSEVRYEAGDHGIYEYLRRTALANPHAQIKLLEPEGKEWVFMRSVNKVPDRPPVTKPHPAGLDVNDLIEFAHLSPSRKISSFLTETFARTTSNKIDEIKAEDPTIDLDKPPKDLQWDDAEKLVKVFRKIKWIAPDPASVVPIGAENVTAAIKSILDPEHMSVIGRKPKVFRGGVPFVVEAAVSYGGNSGKKVDEGYSGTILRYANRVPLLFDSGSCAITKAANDIDWKRYGLDLESQPISIFVNVSSVYIPYSGVGKEAVSQEEEIVEEIKLAIMEAARGIQRYVRGKEQISSSMSRYKAIARYVKQLSGDISSLTGKSQAAIESKLDNIIKKHFPKLSEEDEENADVGGGGEESDSG